jgi:hypothetical protein
MRRWRVSRETLIDVGVALIMGVLVFVILHMWFSWLST